MASPTESIDLFALETPLGLLRYGLIGDRLALVAFADQLESAEHHLRRYGAPERRSIRRSRGPLAARFLNFLSGNGDALNAIELELYGSPFQRRVWQELRRVRAGETTTYARLAAACGSPHGARAVGGAVGANPLLLVIPCHRVVAAGGRLGGFSSGLARKRRLLAIEGHTYA